MSQADWTITSSAITFVGKYPFFLKATPTKKVKVFQSGFTLVDRKDLVL